MTRFASLLTAAALIAGSTTAALADHAKYNFPDTYGTQVEVRAGDVLSTKDLFRNRLNADDTISLTVAPALAPAPNLGKDR